MPYFLSDRMTSQQNGEMIMAQIDIYRLVQQVKLILQVNNSKDQVMLVFVLAFGRSSYSNCSWRACL